MTTVTIPVTYGECDWVEWQKGEPPVRRLICYQLEFVPSDDGSRLIGVYIPSDLAKRASDEKGNIIIKLSSDTFSDTMLKLMVGELRTEE